MKRSMERVGVLAFLLAGAWMMDVHATPATPRGAAVVDGRAQVAEPNGEAISDKPTDNLTPAAWVELR